MALSATAGSNNNATTMVNGKYHMKARSYRSVSTLLTALSCFMLLSLVFTHRAAYKLTATAGVELGNSVSLSSSSSSTSMTNQWDNSNPLGIPDGEPPNLPTLETTKADDRRSIFGGKGDPYHLGGFTDYDASGVSPEVWSKMITDLGVKSVLDVGCGRGISTSFFRRHGIRTRCVEGSKDAIQRTVLTNPEKKIVEHDYSRGPWWPKETYDAVWAVEVLAQVSRQHMFNYMTTFRKAALIFVTTNMRGGWHGVELHEHGWWIAKFELNGFRYSQELTDQVKNWARQERNAKITGPDDNPLNAQHIWLNAMVFINPIVAALPEHQHLFPEQGCLTPVAAGMRLSERKRKPCEAKNLETPLAPSFVPFAVKPEVTKKWSDYVRSQLGSRGAQKNRTSEENIPAVSQEMVPLMKKIDSKQFEDLPTLSLVVYPMIEIGVKTGEHRHVEQDGTEQSPFIKFSDDMYDFDPNVVWVGDIGCCKVWREWCVEYGEKIREAKERRKALGLPLQWPVFIIDFTDGIQHPHCTEVDDQIGEKNVRYTTRSLARRGWDERIQWTRSQKPIPMKQFGHDYLHTPLTVRTDTIAGLDSYLKKKGMPLTHPIEKLPRPVDISHFWPAEKKEGPIEVNHNRGNLRSMVSRILDALGKKEGLNTFLGVKGKAINEGRTSVREAYIEGLLEAKIVVVTQRDAWEDHYRLMEALIGGAMVMTDKMFGMPAGLKNGTSIIEFDSAESLKSLVMHYLSHDEERIEIGRQGRYVAMSRHRSWHRMEEIVFGEPRSTCGKGNNTGNCPFVVNLNETHNKAPI